MRSKTRHVSPGSMDDRVFQKSRCEVSMGSLWIFRSGRAAPGRAENRGGSITAKQPAQAAASREEWKCS